MIEVIRARLAGYEPQYVLGEDHLPRAAVLLPLYDTGDEPHILFTKRSELVEHHKGQISFPGGAHDPEDHDLAYTAVRETFEEIGVATDHVELLGQLDEMITVSNFLVRPFVGRITEPGPYPFAHSEIEVAEILEVPLSHLRDEANVLAEQRVYQGREVTMYSYKFRDHVIWGATARILHQFLDLLVE